MNDMDLWRQLVRLDRDFLQDQLAGWLRVQNKSAVLREALATVTERGAALRLLLVLGEDVRMAVFEDVIELASVGHADIAVCRSVIKSLPRKWTLRHIEAAVDTVLARDDDDEEAYARYAELYLEVDDRLFAAFLRRMKSHANEQIREFAAGLEEDWGRKNKELPG